MSDVATWIGAVAGAVALVFTVLSYLKRRGRTRIEYVVTMSRRILPGRVAEDLEVRHHGVVIPEPALSVVRMVNTGDRAIRAEDFETDLTVTFEATRELVSASWSATRPDDLRPGIQIKGTRLLIAPKLINPGDMLELQVLSAGPPSGVSVAGRVADLVVVRRQDLPYPLGFGPEGELLRGDRFAWYVLAPATIIGGGFSLTLLDGVSGTSRAVILLGTALVLAAYLLHTSYLVRRHRRWRP